MLWVCFCMDVDLVGGGDRVVGIVFDDLPKLL